MQEDPGLQVLPGECGPGCCGAWDGVAGYSGEGVLPKWGPLRCGLMGVCTEMACSSRAGDREPSCSGCSGELAVVLVDGVLPARHPRFLAYFRV